jgi:hypothetical protein
MTPRPKARPRRVFLDKYVPFAVLFAWKKSRLLPALRPAFLFVLHPIWKRPTDILAHARKCQIRLAFNPVGISSYKRGCPPLYLLYIRQHPGCIPRTEKKRKDSPAPDPALQLAPQRKGTTLFWYLLFQGSKFFPSALGSANPAACATVGAMSRISINPSDFPAATPGPTRKNDARSSGTSGSSP